MKKFELTQETKLFLGKTLYRIKALISFGSVSAGDIGGWIEKEENLSQNGNAWVSGNASVSGNARVSGNASVSGNAHIMWISKIGSRNDTITFMRSKELKIIVIVGCFSGTLEEFEEKVKETHGENEHAKAYFLAIQLAKLRIDLTEETDARTDRK